MKKSLTISFIRPAVVLLMAWPNSSFGQCPAVLFNGTGYVAQGGLATSVAIGDFNADGRLDLAVSNSQGNNISVFLGFGNGTFPPGVQYGAGNTPESVAIADLNADGKLDIVCANYGNTVSILRGNGNGTFQSAVNYGLGAANRGYFVAIGDLNSDGKPDLAIATASNYNVAILLGNGDCTFQPAVNFGAGVTPIAVAIGDVNLDGQPDLAVANGDDNKISVLLGNGDGTFQPTINFPVSTNQRSIALGDINGDGKLDMFVGTSTDVWIFLANGPGTFHPAFNNGGYGGGSIALGDINGDTKLDVISRSGILLGNGNGTFQPPVQSQGFEESVTLGDLNADGKLDVASTYYSQNKVYAFLNLGPPPSPAISKQPSSQFVEAGTSATFSVFVNWSGPTPVYYQWRRNGAYLSNSERYSGVMTNTLNVSYVTALETGTFDVQVGFFPGTNYCETSEPATLGIVYSTCKGDMNDSGTIDGDDIQLFVNRLLSSNVCP